MKKTSLLITILLISIAGLIAQIPDAINFQAIARGANGQPMPMKDLMLRLTIIDGSATGTEIYQEIHNIKTNEQGSFSIQIGRPNQVTKGTFANIPWETGNKYMKIDYDKTASGNWTLSLGTIELVSVPYAFASRSVAFIDMTGAQDGDALYYNSTTGKFEPGKVSVSGIEWSNISGKPNFAPVATTGSYNDLSDKPVLNAVATSGNYSDLSGKPDLSGYLTTEVDGSVTNEIQNLSLTGNELSISNGNSVTLAAGTAYSAGAGISIVGGVITNTANINTNVPVVQTTAISGLTTVSATSGGNVTNDNGNIVLIKGVCFGTSPNPTTSNTFTSEGNGTQPFSTTFSSLSPNTTYYVRAYATTVAGTGYGNEISFTTNALTTGTLTSSAVFNISNNSASAGGNITGDGGANITERGLCWNTSTNPTIANSKTSAGSGIGSFTASMNGLTQGTLYYVRAYATNSVGTVYGNEISFTTNIIPLPTITTDVVSAITYTGAISGGNTSNDGGNPVTSRGVCYGTASNPTIANSVLTTGSGLGAFVSVISGLTPNTTYYVRAFATNAGGTAYGSEKSFTTNALTTPVLTSKSVTGISVYSANGGGDITDSGGTSITARGVCWNTTGTPTIADSKTIDGTSTGTYNSMITGLAINTTYYVRAYATNTNGTSYGNQVSFTTLATIPPATGVPIVGSTVVSADANNISFNSGGYISSDGGSAVTERGVCWSTSTAPTTANDKTSDGTGTGLYSSIIPTLAGCGTTYYARAYATNSTGTGYGNEVSITSGLLPSGVSTAAVSAITLTSATCGGNITNDGGCTITERGICWNNLPNPTTTNFKTIVAGTIGAFTASISSLYPNYTYYVRAYATNSKGTVYGDEISFTTQAGVSGLAIGQVYGGGIIFHLDATGEHGLICMDADLGTATWGCVGTSIPGTLSTIGSGAANTAAILASCSEPGIAAKLCDNAVNNGYTDWFLPSKDELTLMYLNLHLAGIGGFFSYYWSSTEYSNSTAGTYYFNAGYSVNGNKDTTYRVRAVRAF